jgi:hypothetical protein
MTRKENCIRHIRAKHPDLDARPNAQKLQDSGLIGYQPKEIDKTTTMTK